MTFRGVLDTVLDVTGKASSKGLNMLTYDVYKKIDFLGPICIFNCCRNGIGHKEEVGNGGY